MQPFQIDHIIARKHGGSDAVEDLALACFSCNNHKGPKIAGRHPETGSVVRLFHPNHDDWPAHFELVGALVVGLTPIGRATVEVLALNLDYRTTLGQVLLECGLYPGRKEGGP